MDLHFHQHSPKQNRKRLTKDQVTLLETSFTTNQKLQAERKLELAHKLGLPPRQVAIWFQNRRARQKNHTTELDYKTIQLELDTVLADKRRLEKEVDILRYELNKARHMLLFASKPSATPLRSISASGDDDHASSSSHGNMIYGWEDAGLLPVEELYACMNGPKGQLEI